MKGKAAIFRKAGDPLEIVEFPVPDPQPGAIIIKVVMANICGSDIHTWHGDQKLVGKGPWIPGHEFTGTVYRLGPEVTVDSMGQSLKEGDRVAYQYFKPCGRCYNCIHGSELVCANLFISGYLPAEPPHYFNGAYAEFFYLRPGMRIFKVPDELPNEIIAPLNCALSQVAFGLHEAHIRFGDSVVVQGAGGLGLNAAALAKEMGAGNVIVVDQLDERLKMAESFGADFTINLKEYKSSRDRLAKVRELVGRQGADIVVEVVGLPEVVPEGINMLRPGGTYIWIGNINLDKKVEIDPARIVQGGKKIIGVITYEPWVIPRLMNYLKKNLNKYPYTKVLSHKFKLSEINNAFQASYRREVTRATIVMD